MIVNNSDNSFNRNIIVVFRINGCIICFWKAKAYEYLGLYLLYFIINNKLNLGVNIYLYVKYF